MSAKLVGALVGTVVLLGFVQHICCIVGEHSGKTPPHQHSTAAAMLSTLLNPGQFGTPCVKVATVEWHMELDRPAKVKAGEFGRILLRLFPRTMIHALSVQTERNHLVASFEVHDPMQVPLDLAPIEASLCAPPCRALADRIGGSGSWKPTSVVASVELDVAASAPKAGSRVDGLLRGPPADAGRAIRALWHHWTKRSGRTHITSSPHPEGVAFTAWVEGKPGEEGFPDTLKAWTDQTWALDRSAPVLP